MIRITDVKIHTEYSWGNVKQLRDWNTLRLCNGDWNSIRMTNIIGKQLNVEVTVIENNWDLIKESMKDWQSLFQLASWSNIKSI